MLHRIFQLTLLFALLADTQAQDQIGINIDPERALHVYGTGHQYARLRTDSYATGKTGLELNRGDGDALSTDWRFINDFGTFKIQYSLHDFLSDINNALTINTNGEVGIGTSAPDATLHISSGTSIDGGGGYLMLGPSNDHLVFDYRQIASHQNGSPDGLHIQYLGGNTLMGLNGGNAYMAMGENASVSLGDQSGATKLQIEDEGFQLHVRNSENGINGWNIGASRAGWAVGDNQLIFTPTSSSSDAVLRLMDVSDNDGSYAPVMIYNTENHTLLLDGNEIDTRNTPLYINHNSDYNTYINSSGGRVGMGTTNPQATLHLYTSDNLEFPLILQKNDIKWKFRPLHSSNSLYVYHNNTLMAGVDGISGSWYALSDERFKEDFYPLNSITDRVKHLNVYRYSFKYDADQTKYIGVIAQELKEQFPELVFEAENQYGVSYAQLAVVALKAIQEQQSKIESLRSRVKSLKNR